MATAMEETSTQTKDEQMRELAERLQAMWVERAGLSQQIASALTEGDDKLYRELKVRQDTLPGEQLALEIRYARLRVEYERQQKAQAEQESQAAFAEYKRLQQAVEDTQREYEAAEYKRLQARVAVETQGENVRQWQQRLRDLIAQAERHN